MSACVEFDIRDDTVPSAPRLIIRSFGAEVYETGMLHGDETKRVATAMIAAARRIHAFTDDEVAAVQPALSIMERSFEAWRAGKSVPIPDGSTPANDAFRV